MGALIHEWQRKPREKGTGHEAAHRHRETAQGRVCAASRNGAALAGDRLVDAIQQILLLPSLNITRHGAWLLRRLRRRDLQSGSF
jgi:hypothetical protein